MSLAPPLGLFGGAAATGHNIQIGCEFDLLTPMSHMTPTTVVPLDVVTLAHPPAWGTLSMPAFLFGAGDSYGIVLRAPLTTSVTLVNFLIAVWDETLANYVQCELGGTPHIAAGTSYMPPPAVYMPLVPIVGTDLSFGANGIVSAAGGLYAGIFSVGLKVP